MFKIDNDVDSVDNDDEGDDDGDTDGFLDIAWTWLLKVSIPPPLPPCWS